MKKVISIALSLGLALTLAACEAKPAETGGKEKIKVVATIFPPYDFARAVAGGKAEVAMLLPPGSETHSFEPTPQDIIKIQNCDVFIHVGGESDVWVEKVMESMDTSRMKILTLMDCVKTVPEKVVEGMQEEESGEPAEDEGAEYDEHVWTAPRNAKLIVGKISATLGAVDEANADIYKQNAVSYQAALDELDSRFQKVVDRAVRKTIVFGDRFPFRYFADAYGLEYFAAFPGCSTETEASAATVKFLIDKITAEKIPVVFHIEFGNENMSKAISEATGAKVRLFQACHNISKSDFTAGKTYIDLMTANVEPLAEALR